MADSENPIPCIYGLKRQARSLVAQGANSERNRFFAGTLGLRQENELHLLDFDEDAFEISSHIYKHPKGEVWGISPSPSAEDLVFTCHKEVQSNRVIEGATLWRLPEISTDETGRLTQNHHCGALVEVLRIEPAAPEDGIHKILWNPKNKNQFASFGKNLVQFYKINDGSQAAPASWIDLAQKLEDTFKTHAAAWNPRSDEIALGRGTSLHGIDIRNPSKTTFTIHNAHSIGVTDVDYNINKPFILASSGKDCRLKVWDCRNPSQPLKDISEHSHWIWNVSFNAFHDQLILSASSDTQVNLQNLSSISSSNFDGREEAILESLKKENGEESQETSADDLIQSKTEDGLVAAYDPHEDSVYALAWSGADPWTFAALSFDGIVSVNTVPAEHKYKIIL